MTLAAVWAVGELVLRRAIPYEIGDKEEMYVKSENEILKRVLKPGYQGIYNLLSSIKGRSYFAQYMLSRIAALVRRIGIHKGYVSEFRGAYEEDSKNWLEYREALLKFRDFAEENNSEILLLVIPFLSDLNEYHPLKREINIVTNFGRANNMDTMNLFLHFRGYKAKSLWINPINGRPNQKAHSIMADVVSKHILREYLEAIL